MAKRAFNTNIIDVFFYYPTITREYKMNRLVTQKAAIDKMSNWRHSVSAFGSSLLVNADVNTPKREILFTKIVAYFVILGAIVFIALMLLRLAEIAMPFFKTRVFRFLDISFFERLEEVDPESEEVFDQLDIIDKEEAYFFDLKLIRYYCLRLLDDRYQKTKNFFLVFTRFQLYYNEQSFVSRLLAALEIPEDTTVKQHLDLKALRSLLFEKLLRANSQYELLQVEDVENEVFTARIQGGFDMEYRYVFSSPHLDPYPTEHEQKKAFEFFFILFYFMLFYTLPWFYLKGKRNSEGSLPVHSKLLQLRRYKNVLHVESLNYRDRFLMTLLSGLILGDPKLDLFEHMWKEIEKGSHLNWAGFRRKKALIEFRHYQSARMYERLVRANAALYLDEALKKSFHKPIYYSNPFKYQDKRVLRVQTNLFYKKRFHLEFKDISFRPILQAYSHRFMTALREHPTAIKAKRHLGAFRLERAFFLRKYHRRQLAERQLLNILAAQRRKDRRYRLAQYYFKRQRAPFNRFQVSPYTNFKNVDFDFFSRFYAKRRLKKLRYQHLDLRIMQGEVIFDYDWRRYVMSRLIPDPDVYNSMIDSYLFNYRNPEDFAYFVPSPRSFSLLHFFGQSGLFNNPHFFSNSIRVGSYRRSNTPLPLTFILYPNPFITNFYDRFNLVKFEDRVDLGALFSFRGYHLGVYGFTPWWNRARLNFLDIYTQFMRYDKPDFFAAPANPLKFYAVYDQAFDLLGREDFNYDENDFFAYHADDRRLVDQTNGYLFFGDAIRWDNVLDFSAIYPFLEFELKPDFINSDIDTLFLQYSLLYHIYTPGFPTLPTPKPIIRPRKWYYRRYMKHNDELVLPRGLLPIFSFIYPNFTSSTAYFNGAYLSKGRQRINMREAKFFRFTAQERAKLLSLMGSYWPLDFNNMYSMLRLPAFTMEGSPVFFLNFLNWDYAPFFNKGVLNDGVANTLFNFGPLNSRDYFRLSSIPTVYSRRILSKKLYFDLQQRLASSQFNYNVLRNNFFAVHNATERKVIDAQNLVHSIANIYNNIVFRPVYRGMRWKRRYSLRQWRLLKLVNQNYMDPYLFNKLASLYTQELDYTLFSNSLQRWAHRYGHFHFDYTGTFYEPYNNLMFLTRKLAPFTGGTTTVDSPGMYDLPDDYYLIDNPHRLIYLYKGEVDAHGHGAFIGLHNPYYHLFPKLPIETPVRNTNVTTPTSDWFIIPFYSRLKEFLQYLNPFNRKVFLGFSDKHKGLDYPYAFPVLSGRDPWYFQYFHSFYLGKAINNNTYFVHNLLPFPFLFINHPVHPVLTRFDLNLFLETFPNNITIMDYPDHPYNRVARIYDDYVNALVELGHHGAAINAIVATIISRRNRLFFRTRYNDVCAILDYYPDFMEYVDDCLAHVRSSVLFNFAYHARYYAHCVAELYGNMLMQPNRHFQSYSLNDHEHYEIFRDPTYPYYGFLSAYQNSVIDDRPLGDPYTITRGELWQKFHDMAAINYPQWRGVLDELWLDVEDAYFTPGIVPQNSVPFTNHYFQPYLHAARVISSAQAFDRINFAFPCPINPFGYNFSVGSYNLYNLPLNLRDIPGLLPKDNLGIYIRVKSKPTAGETLVKAVYPKILSSYYTPTGIPVQRLNWISVDPVNYSIRYPRRLTTTVSGKLSPNIFSLYPVFLSKFVDVESVTFEDLLNHLESRDVFMADGMRARYLNRNPDLRYFTTDETMDWEDLLDYYGLSFNSFGIIRNNSLSFVTDHFFSPHHLGQIKLLPILALNDRRRRFDSNMFLKQNLFFRDLWNENLDLYKLKHLNLPAYLDYLADSGLYYDPHFNDFSLRSYYKSRYNHPLLSTLIDLPSIYNFSMYIVPIHDSLFSYPNVRFHGDFIKELKSIGSYKAMERDRKVNTDRFFPHDSFFFKVISKNKEFPRYRVPLRARLYYYITDNSGPVNKKIFPHALDWARYYPNFLIVHVFPQPEEDIKQTLKYFSRYTLLRREASKRHYIKNVFEALYLHKPWGQFPYYYSNYSKYPYYRVIPTPLLNAIDLHKILLADGYIARFFETSSDLVKFNYLSNQLLSHDLLNKFFMGRDSVDIPLNSVSLNSQLPLFLQINLFDVMGFKSDPHGYIRALLSSRNTLINRYDLFSDLLNNDLINYLIGTSRKDGYPENVEKDSSALHVGVDNSSADTFEPLWDNNFYKLREFRPSDSRHFWPNDLGTNRRILKRIANYRIYAPTDNRAYFDSLDIRTRYLQNEKLYLAIEKIFALDNFDEFMYAMKTLILSNKSFSFNTLLTLRRLCLRITPENFYNDPSFVARTFTKMKKVLLNELAGDSRRNFKDQYYQLVSDRLVARYSSNQSFVEHPFSSLISAPFNNCTENKEGGAAISAQNLRLARRLAYRDAVYYLNSIVIFGSHYLGFSRSSLKTAEDFINDFAEILSANPTKLVFPNPPTNRLGLLLVKIFVFKFTEYYREHYKKIQSSLLKFSYFQELNNSDTFLPPLWAPNMYHRIGHPYLITRVTLPGLLAKLKKNDNRYQNPYDFMRPLTDVFIDLAPSTNFSVLQQYDYRHRFKILLQKYNDYAEFTRKQIIHHLANNDLESAYTAYLNCYVPLLSKPVNLTFKQFSDDNLFQYFLTKNIIRQYYYDIANKTINGKQLFIPKFVMFNYLKNFIRESSFMRLFSDEVNFYANQAQAVNFFTNLEDQRFLNQLHKLSMLVDNSHQRFWSAYVLPSTVGSRLATYRRSHQSMKDLFWELRHFTRYPYQHRQTQGIAGIEDYRRFLTDPVINRFLGGLDVSYLNKKLASTRPLLGRLRKMIRSKVRTPKTRYKARRTEFAERKDRLYTMDDLIFYFKKKLESRYLTFISVDSEYQKSRLQRFFLSPKFRHITLDLNDYKLLRYFRDSGKFMDPQFKPAMDHYIVPFHEWYRNNKRHKVNLRYLPSNNDFLSDQNIFLNNFTNEYRSIYDDLRKFYYKKAFFTLTEDEVLSYQLAKQRFDQLNNYLFSGLPGSGGGVDSDLIDHLMSVLSDQHFVLYRDGLTQLQNISHSVFKTPSLVTRTRLWDTVTESSKYKLNYKLFDKHLKEIYLQRFHRLPLRYTDVVSKRSAFFKNNWRPSNKRLKLLLNRRKNLLFKNRHSISFRPYRWSWYDELRAMVGLTTPRRVRYSDFRTLRELTSYELEQLGLHYLTEYYPYLRMWYYSTHPEEYQNLMSYYTSDQNLLVIYEFIVPLQYHDFSGLPCLMHYRVFAREAFYENPFWASVSNSAAALSDIIFAYSLLFIFICFLNYVIPKIVRIITKFTTWVVQKCVAWFTRRSE